MEYFVNNDNDIDSSFDDVEDLVKDINFKKLSCKQCKSDNNYKSLDKNETTTNKINNIINQDKYKSQEHNNKEKENIFIKDAFYSFEDLFMKFKEKINTLTNDFNEEIKELFNKDINDIDKEINNVLFCINKILIENSNFSKINKENDEKNRILRFNFEILKEDNEMVVFINKGLKEECENFTTEIENLKKKCHKLENLQNIQSERKNIITSEMNESNYNDNNDNFNIAPNNNNKLDNYLSRNNFPVIEDKNEIIKNTDVKSKHSFTAFRGFKFKVIN